MSDADRLDRLLAEAGERWRAGLSGTPPIEAVWQPSTRAPGPRVASLLVAAGLVVLLAVAAANMGGAPRPSPSAVGPSPSPSVPGSCLVTLRSDVGPLASQLAALSLPGSLVPYGLPALWTTIPRSGSVTSGVSSTGGRFVRTFWYSNRWSITDEPSPSISVAAGRFGGGESVVGSAAVSAHSRELGDSMIVSLDLPSGGCWQVTGTYRDQSLSYVVWVEPRPTGPIYSSAMDYPADIDGLPVTNAADAAAALAATKPGESILVGGWLTPDVFMSCPDMQTFPDLWNVCFAIRLAASPWSGEFVAVYRGTSGEAVPAPPEGEVEPVVLRAHSHDPGCPATADCASLAVLDAIVWLGRVGPPPPPTSTPPPNGLSRQDAIRDAIGISFNNGGTLAPEVVSVVAGPYALVQPNGRLTAGDRWVWVVTLRDQVPPPNCPPTAACPVGLATRVVILDYVDGSLVIAETSMEPSPSP